jgi:hypothetical protein
VEALTSAELLRRRLAGQFLIGPPARRVQDVIRRLGAVQAQDYPGARWALAQRCRGVTAADIDDLLNRGRILRTHVLRPTWHLVLPTDIRWLLRLTGPRVVAGMAGRNRQLDIDASLVRRTEAALAKILADGPLTRTEIGLALAGAGIRARNERLGHLMGLAEFDEVVVSGGLKGKQQTYDLLDRRAPPLRSFDRDKALAELARRYFASHSPAQVGDLAWWGWLTLTDARRAIAAARPRLASAVVDGKTFWYLPTPAPPPFKPPLALLLPNYDEYDVAYRDHHPNQHAVLAARPRPQGAGLPHGVAMDGLVIGGWRRTLAPDHVQIRFKLARKLTPTERRALQVEADRYAAHLGLAGAKISGA